MRPLVWMSKPLSVALAERFSADTTSISSVAQFLAAPRDADTVSFMDHAAIVELERTATERGIATAELLLPGHVIGICDGPLQTAMGWLLAHPWLSHVVSAAMLGHPMAAAHLDNVVSTLVAGRARLLDWVRPTLDGRRVRLSRASARVDRLERMAEFFAAKGVGARTIGLLRDAADELITNAFYDAPVAAGAVTKPIAHTLDVSLPEDSACDVVYGCTEDFAIVRVRDPFGALSRTRLVEVLSRGAGQNMNVDGPGLGLWRILSAASFVAISVVNQHHTDVLVGVGQRDGNAGARPFAFHLFFKEGATRRFWSLLHENAGERSFATSISGGDL